MTKMQLTTGCPVKRENIPLCSTTGDLCPPIWGGGCWTKGPKKKVGGYPGTPPPNTGQKVPSSTLRQKLWSILIKFSSCSKSANRRDFGADFGEKNLGRPKIWPNFRKSSERGGGLVGHKGIVEHRGVNMGGSLKWALQPSNLTQC